MPFVTDGQCTDCARIPTPNPGAAKQYNTLFLFSKCRESKNGVDNWHTIVPHLKELDPAAGVAQSVYRIATVWDGSGSKPGGCKRLFLFHVHPDRPWCPPSLLYKWYPLSFPGVKRPVNGANL